MIALLTRELRENARWAGLAALLVSAGLAWGLAVDLPRGLSLVGTTISAGSPFVFGAVGLGLGLLAVLPDARRGRWQFVMHRPVAWGRIFAAKAAAATLLYAAATVPPVLLAYAWAAVPGHVPGPVTPDLLVPRLADAAAGLAWLAGGLLVAARRARWVGSRLVPLVGVLLVTFVAVVAPIRPWEFAGLVTAAVALLVWPARAAFVGGGDLATAPPRAAAGLWLAGGWLVIAVLPFAAAAAVLESVAPRRILADYRWYRLLSDGQVAVESGSRTSLTDLAGRSLGGDAAQMNDRFLRTATLDLSSPRPHDLGRAERQSDGGFHAAAGHLRQLGATSTTDQDWFYVVSRNTVEGFDQTTRRSVGCLSADGWSADPRPFPEPLQRLGGLMSYGMEVAGDRTVWELDFGRRSVRRAFTADAGDAVLDAGQFFARRAGDPPDVGWPEDVVVTRRAVYVTATGKPTVRVPLAVAAPAPYLLSVGRTTDGRLMLDYAPQSVDPAAPPHRLVFAGGDGRTLSEQVLPPLNVALLSPADSGRVLGVLASPPGLVAGVECVGGPAGGLTARDLAASAGMAVAAAAVATLLARRRQFGPAGVAGWAVLGLLLGTAGVLVLVSLAEAVPTVPCPACGRRRPVSRDRCPHCGAGFAPPAAVGIEVFQAA